MRPEVAAVHRQKLFSSPEVLLTSQYGFGLHQATELQRALSYVVCAVPIPDRLWTPTVAESFGGVRPNHASLETILLAGIRGAKTLLSGVAVTWATQHVHLPDSLRQGEVPRVSIVSKFTDQAKVGFGYLKGAFLSSEPLNALLLEEPTEETILVRHPSGRPIEIMVIAGARAGTTLISRWCGTAVFDEAPRIASETDAAVNLDAQRSALIGRMLKGAKIFYIGSPHGAIGTVYKLTQENYGQQGQKVVVCRARGDLMNPSHWTPEEQESKRLNDPDGYRTDFLAEFLDPEQAMFSAEKVDAAVRQSPLEIEPEPGHEYTACMDPATRGNSWTYGIADTTDNRRHRVVLARQWTGSTSEPLDSFEVLGEIAEINERYGIKSVLTDQWAVDPLRDIARTKGVELAPVIWNQKNKVEMAIGFKARIDTGAIELPPIPILRDDLMRVRKRLGSGDTPKIFYPETADGRHCDYAAMLFMMCGGYIATSIIVSPYHDEDEDDDDEIEESAQLEMEAW